MRVLWVGLLLISGVSMAAVVAPYEDSFTSDPQTNDHYLITITGDLEMRHDVVNDQFQVAGVGTGGGTFRMVTKVDNLGDEKDFRMEMTVDTSSVWNQMRLNVLQDETDANTGYSAYLRTRDTAIVLYDNGTAVGSAVPVSVSWSSTGTIQFTLAGSYLENDSLELTLTVSDGTTSQFITYTDSDPATGQYFGVAGRAVANEDLAFDEMTLRAKTLRLVVVTAAP